MHDEVDFFNIYNIIFIYIIFFSVLTSALEKSRATNGVLEGQLQYAYSRAQSHHQPMLTSAGIILFSCWLFVLQFISQLDSPAVLEHRNVPALSSTVPPVVINHACNCQEHKPWCLPHTEWFWVFQALDRHLSPNDLGN